MPSPLHRDPDEDGDDYGCIHSDPLREGAANAAVAEAVSETVGEIEFGNLADDEEIVDFVRHRLQAIGCGACDTIVKENVFYALSPAIKAANIAFDDMLIYGW